jgi:hypothetical protein
MGWPEFVSIYNESSFVTIIAHFASDHFNGHADLDGVVVHVGELGGEHGTFFEFDEGNSIGSVGIVAARRFVDGGVRINFAFAAKGVQSFGFVAAVRANIARGEDLVVAVGADLADQSVALLLESPMSWDFHGKNSFL